MNRGYFADMQELKKHDGKIAMASDTIIPAMEAVKFPSLDAILLMALKSNADKAILSKNLATLRSDLPSYMVPYTTSDLLFMKPTDDGERFRNLLRAISAYAEGHSADYLIRRSDFLWKKLRLLPFEEESESRVSQQ